MRIAITLFLLLFIVELSGAQTDSVMDSIPGRKVNTAISSGGRYSAWYNYARLIDQEAIYKTYFKVPLFPDSTVYTEFDNGYDKVPKHSLGQVLDPCAPLFSKVNLQLDTNTSYHLDSIGIYYRYFRYVGSQPDLLVIQVYKMDKLNLSENPNWSSRASYASVGYDPILRRGVSADKDFTFFLEDKDSTGFGNQKMLKLSVDWEMEPGDKVGVVVTYFPINPYSTGDTLDPYSSIALKRKMNALLMYELRDNAPIIESGYYNNGLVATTDVRYDASWSFWQKRYKPGTLWASSLGIYHSDISFLISTEDPIGKNEQKEKGQNNDFGVSSLGREVVVRDGKSTLKSVALYSISGSRMGFDLSQKENTLTIRPKSSYRGVAFLKLNERAYKVYFID